MPTDRTNPCNAGKFSLMLVPDGLLYSSDHEWARVDAGRIVVGITDYAQDALGDVVYVSIHPVGTVVASGETCGEVESTKSVSDIFAPASGRIVEVNESLNDSPETLNNDPYGSGWLFVLEFDDPAVLESLLDAPSYQTLTEGS